MMDNKKLAGVFFAVILMAVLFVEGSILRALVECGYGMAELPKTTLVFLKISKGFTPDGHAEDGMVEFIGSSKDTYEEYFDKKGYRRMYSLDGVDHYGKTDGDDYDFAISCTEKNSWFAVYKISEDYPIEDFSSK
ncbi:hypothetical protein [Ruminococcus albus]|nr:hypothetical protein [Ruminococcus albus]